jgi:hypothetical protein
VKRLDAAHVNAEIQPVGICGSDKGAQRCRAGGTVDQLKELLVLEAVYDAEKFLARVRWRKELRAIGGCHARCEGFPGSCGRLAIPAKQPADEETDVQERAHERRGCAQTSACSQASQIRASSQGYLNDIQGLRPELSVGLRDQQFRPWREFE